MAVTMKEKIITTYSIEDVRNLSYMEIVGMIVDDLVNAESDENHYYNFIDLASHNNSIIRNLIQDYKYHCNPDDKSVIITLGENDPTMFPNEKYIVTITPAGENGVSIKYQITNPKGEVRFTDYENWDIDRCMELLSIDYNEEDECGRHSQ